jgi:hypothetical protein
MKRLLKRFLYVILSLLLLAGIGIYILRNYAQELILHRLQAELEATFDQFYNITFESLTTGIEGNTFTIQIIKPVFTTDTSQQYYLQKYPALFFEADTFEVGGINIPMLILGQSIELEVLKLNNPQLVVLMRKEFKPLKQDENSKQKKSRKLIRELFFEKLKIEKGNIAFIHLQNTSDTLYYGEKINLEISKARIPTLADEGIYNASKIGNILFSMSNVCFYPEKSPYSFFMDEIKFNARQNILNCRKVSVYPEKSMLSLSKTRKYQKTFAEADIGNVSLHGIDYNKIGEPALYVKHVEISNSHFSLLRNRNKLLNKSIYKKTMQELVEAVQFPLNIDTVSLKNIYVTIDIHFPDRKKPATIKLHQMKGTILHVNSSPKARLPMQLHATGVIMKTGKLTFDATFSKKHPTHTYHATITNMPFTEWNEVISRLANVELTSGKIEQIKLDGNATSLETHGNIVFEYRDLQTTVFKKDKLGNNKKAPILTYIANGFLRLHNPEVGKTIPVTKEYYYKREPYQGQIMLWVGGLLDGIEATLLNEKLKKQVDKVEEQKQENRKR